MILSAIGSHRPLSGKTNSIYSGSLHKAKTDQCHTSPLELGKHELTERPCSYDFPIMKRLNFMNPPNEFALTVIARPVPTRFCLPQTAQEHLRSGKALCFYVPLCR